MHGSIQPDNVKVGQLDLSISNPKSKTYIHYTLQ